MPLTIQDILDRSGALILETQENSITPPRVGELTYALAELILQGASSSTSIGARRLRDLEDVALLNEEQLDILQLMGTKWQNTKLDITLLSEILRWFKKDASGNIYTEENFYSTKDISAEELRAQGLEIGTFTPGPLGAGGALKMNNGISELEVDKLNVRMVATFVELLISKLTHVGGQIVLTPARMKVKSVVDGGSYYRCFFDRGENNEVNNDFVPLDQARCQVFSGSGQKFYWRLVTSVGEDWINLSKSDCVSGSDIPTAGDEIVQLGNRNNPDRQSAQILSTVGDDAPSYKQYSGINSFSLVGKEQTVLSPSGNKIIGDVTFKRTNGNYENLEIYLENLYDSILNDVNGDVATAIANYNTTVGLLLESLKDGILNTEERNNFANWLKIIEKDKAEIQASFEQLYENENLIDGSQIKINLLAAKDALYGSDWYGGVYAILVSTITDIVIAGDAAITGQEYINMNSSADAYKNALALYAQRVREAENSIQAVLEAQIADAKSDAATALSNYSNSVTNLLSALEDSVLSDAERKSYANWLQVIAKDKAEIQASYQLLYDNPRVNATAKANLLSAKNGLYGTNWTGGSYASLVSAINTVVTNGNNDITQSERDTINTAFINYNSALGAYSQRVREAENSINSILSAEIDDARNDAATALSNYSNSVTGLLSALEDSVLSDAERKSYANWLQVIAKDKAEIQASYQLLYDNPRVNATAKANLLSAKNGLYGASWTGGSYASLVSAINTIIVTGDDVITQTERDTVNAAFTAYNTTLATYAQRVREAENGIIGDLSGEIDNATDTANDAMYEAQNATSQIVDMGVDGKLTPVEKLQTKQLWNVISQEYSKNITQAGVYSVSTITYTTKYNVLNSYLNLTGGLLVDMITTSSIVRSVYETRFNEYYAARQELLNNIVLAAKAYSNALINNLYVGGVNLIVGTTRTVTAAAGQNYMYNVIYGSPAATYSPTAHYLENGQKYVFSVGKIEKLAGTASNVRVLVYDLTTNTAGPAKDDFIFTSNRQFFSFTVPASGYYSLLIYAGLSGSTAGNSVRYSQLMLQKGEVYTQFTESIRHLTEALEGSTEILGGLIATNLLMMKDANENITAGISGLDDNIWLWAGGNYGDAGTENVVDLFRKDGSGFLAGGNLWWNALGELFFGKAFDSKTIVITPTGNIPTLAEIGNKEKYSLPLVNSTIYKDFNNPSHTGTVSDLYVSYMPEFELVNDAILTIDTEVEYSWGSGLPQFGADGNIKLQKYNGATWIDIYYGEVSYGSLYYNCSFNIGNIHVLSGKYRIHAEFICGGETPSGANATVTLQKYFDIKYQLKVKKLVVASDGIAFLDSLSDNYFRLSLQDSIPLRYSGGMDIPGILLAGDGYSGGGGVIRFGVKKHTSIVVEKLTGNGYYRIWHTIGHDLYTVQLTLRTGGGLTAIWENPQNTYFDVKIYSGSTLTNGNFSFAVYGKN